MFTATNARIASIDSSTVETEIALLNSQWNSSSKLTDQLDKIIAMVDFSASMYQGPIEAAFALGCRVAEKSKLGKRVLSFSSSPTWHNLDNCSTFVEMIETLQSGTIGYSTNFYKALSVILDSIIEYKIPPEEVENMILAIFSDMQINEAGEGLNMNTMYENITKLYKDAGIKIWGKPFRPPHILFWNLRNTAGFPCLSNESNVSMMSGFSPALLNSFCKLGMDALKDFTPWSMLVSQLNNPRYDSLKFTVSSIK